ncbi:ubiquitin-like modifier-activating enzyme ATG7 [Mytilus edulis]|uniref:ubiquitin-like modifier-activating enzyme ATG7 n=1 Tax=Mytilus edulis TaxID=6550 RepID=UPI0039F02D3A
MSSQQKKLQFAPFSSFLDAGFWHKLSENKLNVYGLDETPKFINGFYYNGDPAGLPCRLNVEYSAFDKVPQVPSRCFRSHGVLHNMNTIDKFKECDHKELLENVGKKVWEDIVSNKIEEDPSLLSRFLLLTFADLKKYIYYYWFAFPCLCMPEDVTMVTDPVKLTDRLNSQQISELIAEYDKFQSTSTEFVGYFIIVQTKDSVVVDHLKNVESYSKDTCKIFFGFADPCTLDSNPGWPLRNYLLYISYHWGDKFKNAEILCFRDRSKDGVRDVSHSIILTLNISSTKTLTECPKSVGWEKNERQKLGPRVVNLSSSMDPVRLSESAVDLNLKLMRWRLLPELDLEKVAGTKCLLLGAGTLGCNVARCLMGWGVRHITLVDNGRISYSNPVRQSLFQFEDCLNGGKPKAEAAAEALKKIFPGVKATGISLSIPMPGHSVSDGSLEVTKNEVKQLDELVQSHDALFLLLDTRESRWLPTVMAAAYQKIVICAALGFDTFLVMRHGFHTGVDNPEKIAFSSTMSIPGDQLGCYFCNDVVAPGNSTRDRTLDQQCTVSRPGMSYLASALAGELLVSVIQHPLGPKAPADTSAKDEHLSQELSCNLGIVPHQIRCFLSRFHQLLPASMAFDKCTACSKTVIDAYKKDGFDFLLKAFNDPAYLENLTGLTQMHQETLDAEVWDYSDDEECSSMEIT